MGLSMLGFAHDYLGDDDYASDDTQRWTRIHSDAVSCDELGPAGVAKIILNTIGTEQPVYLSVNIDVIDPGLAPCNQYTRTRWLVYKGSSESVGWCRTVELSRG